MFYVHRQSINRDAYKIKMKKRYGKHAPIGTKGFREILSLYLNVNTQA